MGRALLLIGQASSFCSSTPPPPHDARLTIRKKQRRTTAFAREKAVSLGSLIRLNPLARRLEAFTAFTCISWSLSGRPQGASLLYTLVLALARRHIVSGTSEAKTCIVVTPLAGVMGWRTGVMERGRSSWRTGANYRFAPPFTLLPHLNIILSRAEERGHVRIC